MSEKQVFAVTIESTFVRGMKGKLTPALKAKLKAIDLDLDAKLKPAYSLETYLQGLRLAAESAFPGVTREEAYRRIGEASLRSFFEETMIGKLMTGAVKLMGPHRALERAQTQFKTMSNYLRTTVKQTSPSSYEMWLSDVGERGPYFEGVIVSFLKYAGAKDVRFKLLRREGDSATFEITWT